MSGARHILLTRGAVALVDEGDFDMVAGAGQWHLIGDIGRPRGAGRGIYRDGRMRHQLMHRLILGAPEGLIVDHRNRNPLDNRRSNLRLCTVAQNRCNCPPERQRISGITFKGVTAANGRFTARIAKGGRQIYVGRYDTQEQAARAYDAMARLHFGEFAFLNFPDAVAS